MPFVPHSINESLILTPRIPGLPVIFHLGSPMYIHTRTIMCVDTHFLCFVLFYMPFHADSFVRLKSFYIRLHIVLGVIIRRDLSHNHLLLRKINKRFNVMKQNLHQKFKLLYLIYEHNIDDDIMYVKGSNTTVKFNLAKMLILIPSIMNEIGE